MTDLITIQDPRSNAAEAFRSLRTNLMFSSVENPITTLLITSAAQSEGKSVVAANLAVTLAQSGNKTILVDADLRKPVQHTIWNTKNDRGLTTMMLDNTAVSTPPLVDTEIDNLQLLPSGALPPAPADLLSSQRMSEVIGVLKARAHYIIFDSPPILAATDATLLSTKLDGTLLVIRAGGTRREDALRARQSLERVHARIIGAVLSNAPHDTTRYYG